MLKRLFLFVGLAAGCAPYLRLEQAAQHQYHRGDYDAAVYSACASLRHKPDNMRVQFLLQDALRAAVNFHTERIIQLKTTAARFKWDEVVSRYEALVNLSRAIRELPTMRDRGGTVVTITTGDYVSDLNASRYRAAEAHYLEGKRLQTAAGDVNAQKQAALEFRAAEAFVPGYKDAGQRFSQTRQAGTRRVAVVPFEDKSGGAGTYGALTDRIADNIVGAVTSDPKATEFLEMVARDRLEQVMKEQQFEVSGMVDPGTAVKLGALVGAHDILVGQISQILLTPVRTVRKTVSVEDTVKRTEKVQDAMGYQQDKEMKEAAKATVVVFSRTAAATISGSASIIEVKTGAVRRTQPFEGRKDFSYDWATYTGDKRALGIYAGLCDRTEQHAPSEAELVTAAASEMSRALSENLKAFLSQ
jgi:hypothetical protein